MTTPAAMTTATAEAQTLFNAVWPAVEAALAKPGSCLPKAIIWLGGAPGCGKGTQTAFINQLKGFTAQALVTSDLLQTPEMKKIKDSGALVSDKDVVGLLLTRLTDRSYANGLIIDGFPRTLVQGELVKLLHARMAELHQKNAGGARAADFPKPNFSAMVLAVEETQSVERQLKRGREIQAHNDKVKATGTGTLQELRPTDTDPEAARKRYRVFVDQTQPVLAALNSAFPFHLIEGKGSIAETQGHIRQALTR